MSPEDLTSIQVGYERRSRSVEEVLNAEIEGLLSLPDTEYRTRVLATLVASGALDVRLALRPDAKGIFHEKIGVFTDGGGHAVTFLGSANETWSGWSYHGNHEALEVFCSWQGGSEAQRVSRHREYLGRLWRGEVPGLQVLEFPEAAKRRLLAESLDSLDSVDLKRIAPRPLRRKPMPHQESAISAWSARGKRGVLEHATGSGKTFLALTAMRPHIDKGLPVLVLVPSALLLSQWAAEAAEEFPDAVQSLVGAGHDRWARGSRLKSMSAPSPDHGARIIIATMQSAATEGFREKLWGGDHLMVVADEVHQIGSPHNSKSLSISSGPRLGLSATPTRYGDPEGTQRLLEYFGGVIPPPFTIYDAIEAGRLVPYEYFPQLINLSAEEAEEWKDFTRRIILEIARAESDASGNKRLTDRAKMMLIQRARIAKKAVRKIELAQTVIGHEYREGQRWLVYCEDVAQMGSVLNALRSIGIQATEYHTAMNGDPASTLAWFRVSGGVLVSIKCLDEGVDIPAADHALILSSSQNPRQFIQRRGRVLRRSPGKHLARIYDAVVAPVNLEHEPEQLSLLKAEFVRAVEFASHAINRSGEATLRALALELGFDPQESQGGGYEEDE
ncbi:DEAD/DEAH box helicase family protein [Luteimonas sp. MJ246]|uniref:DEAD/DEAH box helicase family protein n=1 Tax=Luteimonas sp. MJ174 TaxID=3129237 RepID=UPI0031BAEB55